MKQSETERKHAPIANGLYQRHAEVYLAPVKAPDRKLTYIMNVAAFEKFVEEIKKIATRAEIVFKYCSHRELNTSMGAKVKYKYEIGLGYNEQGRINFAEFAHAVDPKNTAARLAFIQDYEELRERYRHFFSLVTIQHDGHEYFNLEFYPRKKGPRQQLFTSFVNALFTIHGIVRLKIGRDTKTAALSPEEWEIIKKLRSKSRGTESGSNRFCAEEIRLRRKTGPKKEPALRQAIYREERRRKKTSQF